MKHTQPDTPRGTLFGEPPAFDGPGLNAADHGRLGDQLKAVRDLMADGKWRTLAAISGATGYPEASVSARLRDMRKEKFGGWTVDRRRAGAGGTWEYAVVVAVKNDASKLPTSKALHAPPKKMCENRESGITAG